MKAIEIFRNNKLDDLRVTTTETGDPYFCLSDLCSALDITNSRNVKGRLNEKGICTMDTLTSGGQQKLTYVDESNFYKVIFQSRKPEAEEFTEWVTGTVLPTIRKTGNYALDHISRKELSLMLLQAEEEYERIILENVEKTKALKEVALKVLFADSIIASESSILVGELAKILKQNGIEIGKNRLFSWLRENNYLCIRGESYNQSNQMAMELGLFEIKKTSINQPDGNVFISVTTKVSPKGQAYFINKFLSAA